MSPALATQLAQLNNRRIVLAFDCDDAGTLATKRAACALAPQFEEVLAIGPDGEGDPAEVLSRSGAPVLLAQLLGAGPATDRVVDVRIKKWGGRLDHVDAKVACLREAAGLIARLRPTDPAQHAVQLSLLLGVSADAVTSELIEAMSRPASNLASPRGQKTSRATSVSRTRSLSRSRRVHY